LNTSPCAFSTSSNRMTAYGRRRTCGDSRERCAQQKTDERRHIVAARMRAASGGGAGPRARQRRSCGCGCGALDNQPTGVCV
jgi:hypothetical protein